MRNLQPWLAFAETAKRGNFAAASRDLGCTPSTLAKSVARLEKHLGVRLFHRTTRQVTLTDDGHRLFARSQRVLAEIEQLEEEASGARAEPHGTLRIDMPVAFGRLVMLPLLAELARRHTRISIDARLSDVYVDLVKEGVDVAIRTGALRDSTLVARRFGSQTLLLCAAPSYLASAGTPASVEELTGHAAVLFRVPSHGRERPWQLRVNGRDVALSPPSRVRVDDGDAMAAAAVLGFGITQLPHYIVAEPLARGELVEILPQVSARADADRGRDAEREDGAFSRTRPARSARAQRRTNTRRAAGHWRARRQLGLSGRRVELRHVRGAELQAQRAHELGDLSHRGRARDRRGDRRPSHDPGQRHLRAGRIVPGRDGVERRENLEALGVEILVHAGSARALALVRGAAVLAGQKTARETEVRHDRYVLAHAKRHQIVLDVALHQVVLGLLRREAHLPERSLSASASAKRAAAKFDAPTARTLPASTSSSSAPRYSSGCVLPSSLCSQ